jgi:hypothetical protein
MDDFVEELKEDEEDDALSPPSFFPPESIAPSGDESDDGEAMGEEEAELLRTSVTTRSCWG